MSSSIYFGYAAHSRNETFCAKILQKFFLLLPDPEHETCRVSLFMPSLNPKTHS
jgi:hypothetical protein